MKKLISSLVLAALVTAGTFALDMSAGGGVGTLIYHQNASFADGTNVTYFDGVKNGAPMFGAVFNADFGSFGLEVSFDYSIYQNYSETGKYLNTPYSYKESESLGVLALTPYFPLQLAQFDLIVGPIIGAGFYKYQSETKYEGFDPTTYKQTRSYFIWGGNVELRKEIKDHINGYIGLPLIFRAGSGDLKTWSNGTEVKNEGKSSIFGASKMHFAPKIGVTYSF